MIAFRFLVTGRVQGVGFRWFVAQRAKELGLVGHVSNLPNGQVEVEAAGSADQLAALERHLQHGPRFATVQKVEKSEILDDINHYKSFEIG